MQESVFAWSGTPLELMQLEKQLSVYIKHQEDDLRLYRLAARQPVHLWGTNPFLEGVFDSGCPPHVLEPAGVNDLSPLGSVCDGQVVAQFRKLRQY